MCAAPRSLGSWTLVPRGEEALGEGYKYDGKHFWTRHYILMKRIHWVGKVTVCMHDIDHLEREKGVWAHHTYHQSIDIKLVLNHIHRRVSWHVARKAENVYVVLGQRCI